MVDAVGLLDPTSAGALAEAARVIHGALPAHLQPLGQSVLSESPCRARVAHVAATLGTSRWTIKRRFERECGIDADRLVAWCQLIVAAHYVEIGDRTADDAARLAGLGDARRLRRERAALCATPRAGVRALPLSTIVDVFSREMSRIVARPSTVLSPLLLK